MLQTIKTYFHTQFVVILVLTIVIHNCFGQRVFARSRSNRLVQYNPRYNDRQWRAIQHRRTQFGSHNQNSITNIVLRSSHNRMNANRRVNFRRNGIRDINGQIGRNTPNRRGNAYNRQNSNGNVRTRQGRASNYNTQRDARIYQRPVRQYDTQIPETQRRRYQEQNGRRNNNLNRRVRNRMHSSHIPHRQPRRQPMASNNIRASSGGRRFVTNTRERAFKNQGARNNNGVLASQRSRFGSERNEFRNRPQHRSRTQDNVVREAFKRIGSPSRSQDSLSVPIDRFMSTLRSLYDNNYRTNYDATYHIPEAQSLPRGLEFVGQSYEAKRQEQSSPRSSRRRRNQRNQSVQEIAAKAFGSVLGISEEQINAIVNTPSVNVRSIQSARYPLQNTRIVVNTPSVQVITRKSHAETKAGLLTDIGNTIDQLAVQDNMFKDLNTDTGDSNSKRDYNMPVKMIIISDANTFSKLKAGASARGSLLSSLPSSGINENLFSSATNERTPPTVVVERPSNQGNAKINRETEPRVNTKTVDKSVNDNKVTVVVRHVTKPPRYIRTSSRSLDDRRNTRVTARRNWNSMNYRNGMHSNLINDRRW